MMTRKNNVAMRESNDNVDHKNVVIMWISFACKINILSKEHA